MRRPEPPSAAEPKGSVTGEMGAKQVRRGPDGSGGRRPVRTAAPLPGGRFPRPVRHMWITGAASASGSGTPRRKSAKAMAAPATKKPADHQKAVV
ncbi:hypothetical protein QF032_007147 [Streptomyces achromogenes]|nr:hypothetical protein [Streptomyces achromogenes]